jgi:hypothetical protein
MTTTMGLQELPVSSTLPPLDLSHPMYVAEETRPSVKIMMDNGIVRKKKISIERLLLLSFSTQLPKQHPAIFRLPLRFGFSSLTTTGLGEWSHGRGQRTMPGRQPTRLCTSEATSHSG